MTRKEFLEKLQRELSRLEKTEADAIMQYCIEYLDDAGAENELEAVKELGSPEKIINQIQCETQAAKDAPEGDKNGNTAPDIGSFVNIDISVVAAGINLIRSERSAVEYSFTDNEKLIVCAVDPNTKTLVIQTKGKFGNFFSGLLTPSYVNIYYTDPSAFERISLKTVSGGIKSDSLTLNQLTASTVSGGFMAEKLNSKRLEVKTVSGTISANGTGNSPDSSISLTSTSGTVKSEGLQCGRLEAATTSGSITISSAKTGDCSLHTVSGSLSISGDLYGSNSFQTTSGRIFFQTTAPKSDFDFTISSVSGGTRINGQAFKGSMVSGNKNAVNAKTVSGRIDIDFVNN